MVAQVTKKISGKRKLAIALIAVLTILLVIGFVYSVIYRLQYSNMMMEQGCRIHAYDWLGLPSSWDCPVNLQITAV